MKPSCSLEKETWCLWNGIGPASSGSCLVSVCDQTLQHDVILSKKTVFYSFTVDWASLQHQGPGLHRKSTVQEAEQSLNTDCGNDQLQPPASPHPQLNTICGVKMSERHERNWDSSADEADVCRRDQTETCCLFRCLLSDQWDIYTEPKLNLILTGQQHDWFQLRLDLE